MVVDPVWATDALGEPLEHAAASKATAASAVTTRPVLRGRSRRSGSSFAGVVDVIFFMLLSSWSRSWRSWSGRIVRCSGVGVWVTRCTHVMNPLVL